MKAGLEFFSILLLLTPQCLAATCKTCSGEECERTDSELLRICTMFSPMASWLPHSDPFQNIEKLKYGCLKLEYLKGNYIILQEGCVVTKSIDTVCQDIASTTSYVSCKIESPKEDLEANNILNPYEIASNSPSDIEDISINDNNNNDNESLHDKLQEVVDSLFDSIDVENTRYMSMNKHGENITEGNKYQDKTFITEGKAPVTSFTKLDQNIKGHLQKKFLETADRSKPKICDSDLNAEYTSSNQISLTGFTEAPNEVKEFMTIHQIYSTTSTDEQIQNGETTTISFSDQVVFNGTTDTLSSTGDQDFLYRTTEITDELDYIEEIISTEQSVHSNSSDAILIQNSSTTTSISITSRDYISEHRNYEDQSTTISAVSDNKCDDNIVTMETQTVTTSTIDSDPNYQPASEANYDDNTTTDSDLNYDFTSPLLSSSSQNSINTENVVDTEKIASSPYPASTVYQRNQTISITIRAENTSSDAQLSNEEATTVEIQFETKLTSSLPDSLLTSIAHELDANEITPASVESEIISTTYGKEIITIAAELNNSDENYFSTDANERSTITPGIILVPEKTTLTTTGNDLTNTGHQQDEEDEFRLTTSSLDQQTNASALGTDDQSAALRNAVSYSLCTGLLIIIIVI